MPHLQQLSTPSVYHNYIPHVNVYKGERLTYVYYLFKYFKNIYVI